MFVEFIQRTDVELADVPKRAWGKIQRRSDLIKPPEFPDKAAVHGPVVHYFPVGVIVELPDEQAVGFINAGQAKQAEDPNVKWVDITETSQG